MTEPLFARFSPAEIDGERFIVVPRKSHGAVVWGPYQTLDPGVYDVAFEIIPEEYGSAEQACCRIEVTTDFANVVVLTKDVTVGELLANEGRITATFEGKRTAMFEYRVVALAGAGFRVRYFRKAHPAPAPSVADVPAAKAFHADEPIAGASSEQWLVLSNCQTSGLANCLRMLAPPRITVEAADIWLFRREPAKWLEVARNAHRILANPLFLHEPGFDAGAYRQVVLVPSVDFAAYHPDLCYANAAQGAVGGPIDVYQSILAIAGYRNGLSVERTVDAFNESVFQACGYFELWPSEADRLVSSFKSQNLDISEDLRLWSHGACFMHSINHPKIVCLNAIARALLRAAGVEPLDSGNLPPDNLLNGACWPVYPEIGDRYGVRGGYFFKAPGAQRYYALQEFIEMSFAAFEHFSEIEVLGLPSARFEAALRVLAP